MILPLCISFIKYRFLHIKSPTQDFDGNEILRKLVMVP